MTKNWIRRIVIALGVLVLLLGVAAAVLIATFDANRYKTVAIDWMKAEHQRTLVFDGPIELSFFPRLAVKVSGLRLSEAGREDEFAAVEEAALAVRVMPLLSNELVIDRVSARGVRASYVRDAEGVRNIDDLVSGGDGGEASAQARPGGDASASGGPMRFDVSAVQFDDLRLRVRDEMADVDGELVLLSFSSGRLANKVESPVSLRATARLTRPQAVELALDGRLTLALDLDENAVAMSGLQLGVDGAGAGVDAFSLALEGALAWDGS
ncbi:MAG TPA: AsmA family protein, partial [Thauera sp.]|nr:AsmA family protein [Thauera sp.]